MTRTEIVATPRTRRGELRALFGEKKYSRVPVFART
jgi:hypothetical protein